MPLIEAASISFPSSPATYLYFARWRASTYSTSTGGRHSDPQARSCAGLSYTDQAIIQALRQALLTWRQSTEMLMEIILPIPKFRSASSGKPDMLLGLKHLGIVVSWIRTGATLGRSVFPSTKSFLWLIDLCTDALQYSNPAIAVSMINVSTNEDT